MDVMGAMGIPLLGELPAVSSIFPPHLDRVQQRRSKQTHTVYREKSSPKQIYSE